MTSRFSFAPARPYSLPRPPRILLGTSGLARVMSGGGGWRRAYAAVAGLLGLILVVNVSSRWHEARPGVALWKPLLGQSSSIACVLAFSWIVFAARDRIVRQHLSLARALPMHAAAACCFSALHCLGMWTVRRIVLTASGQPYGWGIPAGQVLYEFRKDVGFCACIAPGLSMQRAWALCFRRGPATTP